MNRLEREIDGVPNGVRISHCDAGSGCERASREEAVTVMALHESLLATGGPGETRFGGPSSPSCLTGPGGSTQNGVGLTVAACNGSTSQRFDFNSSDGT